MGNYDKKRELGIRDVHYVNYRVALVSEIAIRFLSNLAQKASYLLPNSHNV